MADPIDPPRILDDSGASPLGRAVLSSAHVDGPDDSRRTAAAKRLGIAATTLLAGGEVSGAAAAGAFAWWKLGAIVAVLGGALAVAITRWPEPAVVPAPPPAVEVAATIETTPPPRTQIASEPVAPVIEPTVEPPPPRPAPRTTKPRVEVTPVEPPPAVEPAQTEAPAPAPVQVDARRLAAEVALLDRARGALRAGDAATALALLAEHDRDFSDGALVAEAEVVRIETLIHNRQSAAARERAASFLSRFPQSPLARRVRSLLDRLKETP